MAELATLDRDRTLRLHPELAVLHGTAPRVWHLRAGRLEALEPPELGEVLRAFVRARRIGDVLDELDQAGVLTAERVADLLARCLRAGLLVDGADRGVVPGGETLFGAPRRSIAETLVDRPDLVVVGVPYDAGATVRPGSRFAPEALRRASGTCFSYHEEAGEPCGAWDPVAGRILAGVHIADVGDLTEAAPARNGAVIDRLRQTVTHVAGCGARPVVLGGDHSIALPTITGLGQAHGRIGVLHVDAHADRGPDHGEDWRAAGHHGNFVTWALRDDRVDRVVQLGVRQRELAGPPSHPKVVAWPGITAAGADPEQLLADLPAELPWHVSLDVDALDPTVLAATATPVPGGFDAASLARVLVAVARHRRVVGVDVCELLPGSGDAEPMIVCELLVQLLAAATASTPEG